LSASAATLAIGCPASFEPQEIGDHGGNVAWLGPLEMEVLLGTDVNSEEIEAVQMISILVFFTDLCLLVASVSIRLLRRRLH
jgi:hypothetical protein